MRTRTVMPAPMGAPHVVVVLLLLVCSAVVASVSAASGSPIVYFRNPVTASLAKSEDRVSQDIVTSGSGETMVGIALDSVERRMFYSNGDSIQRAALDGGNVTQVVSQVMLYVIGGVNFGGSARDLVAIDIHGVACTSIHYWSSTQIGCVTADPAHWASTPTVYDVGVVSTFGGHSKAATMDDAYAQRRAAEGYSAPMVSSIRSVLRSTAPRALAYDTSTQTLLWSDTATGTIHRSDPDGRFIQLVATGMFEVYGLAVASDTLFYTDHNDGRVVRVNLTAAADLYDDVALSGAVDTRVVSIATGGAISDDVGTQPNAHSKVLLRGFTGLRGIAVDAASGYLYLTEASGNIYRARVDGRNMQRNPRKRKVYAKAIIRRPSTARLDGIAVTQGGEGANPRRVFWTEANTNAVFSATTYGTDVTQLAGQAADMVWPRAIALLHDAGSSYVDHHLFWSQYMGRIHRASTRGENRDAVIDTVAASSGFADVEREVRAAQIAGTPTLFNVE